MPKTNYIVNLLGQKFGCWRVIGLASRPSHNLHHCKWLCECVCGKRRVRVGSNLKKSKNVHGCHCGFSHRLRPFESLYNTLVKQSKGRTFVRLTYEEYLVFFTTEKACHYCNEKVIWQPFNKMNGHHLDRKDNTDGYTMKNCVVCCARCNQAKSNHFTYEEWLQIGALIKTWHT